MISKPLVRRTFATFRSAEFGFLGVVVYTRVQTPRRNGFDLSAGDFSFLDTSRRLRRTSWLIVGIRSQREKQRAHKFFRGDRALEITGTQSAGQASTDRRELEGRFPIVVRRLAR